MLTLGARPGTAAIIAERIAIDGELNGMKDTAIKRLGQIVVITAIVLTSAIAEADCEDACDSGYSSCESECNSTVYNYDRGEYLYNTDADENCESACEAGKSSCESEC